MIRVASYCRVSTDKDDQANSFEAQQRYFKEYIEHQPDWELYEVYADEGITGTSTRKRTQFNRMISDARDGKFNLIVTKEVSRFSRNVLDTIAYTRRLKDIGVAVLFVTDGINTMEPDAELRLSIMASIAQEESRRTSARVTWGQTRQMERGVVFGSSLLGYDVKDGRISLNPEGARIVRLIFHKYAVEQMSTGEIAGYLTASGYRTYRGNSSWKTGVILKILKNEKYLGELVQKKTYTADYLTHKKIRNRGEVPLIRIENHHEPIISREIWDLAQERLTKNNKHTAGTTGCSGRYVFSGRIRCGVCGACFVGRCQYRKDGSIKRRWCCGTAAYEGTKGCSVGKLVRDDDAMNMLKTAIRSLQLDREWIIGNVIQLVICVCSEGAVHDRRQLQRGIQAVAVKKEAVMDSYFSGDITKEEMTAMKTRYDRQQTNLEAQLAHVDEAQKTIKDTTKLHTLLSALLACQEESEVFYKTILESLTIYKDRHIELRLNHLPLVFWFGD